MADIKTLQTRIALKYDSYSNWTDESVEGKGANLVLLKGEIGFCEIPTNNANVTTAPTVLFKVGDGTTPFKTLKWASALAADVYGWAKAADVVLEGKTIKFVDGAGNAVKSVVLNYVTENEVKAITDPLAARIAAVEATLGTDSGSEDSVSSRLEAVEEAIETLTGEGDGSVKKALADAEDYTDAREQAITTAYQEYADQAEADAKEYADEVALEINASIAEHTSNTDNPHSVTAEQVGLGKVENKTTAEIKSEFTGEVAAGNAGFVTGGAAHTAIEAAKNTAIENANNKVNELATGAVASNTTKIGENTAAIAEVAGNLEDETTARIEADEALDARLGKVETFFTLEEGKTLDQALDTLVEIQEYLNGEGDATGGIISRVATNESNIKALQDTLADGGEFEQRIDRAEAATAAVDERVDTLESVTKGYTAEGAIKTAVDEADRKGQQGIDDAATAQEAAEAAQGDVDELKGVVEDPNSGLAKTKQIADEAAAEAARAHERLDTAEGDIADLEAIVVSGADANDKLRADIAELQGIAKTGANNNAALRQEIGRVAGIVENANTGLAKTKEIADAASALANENKAKIAAIEADYLKAEDLFIINCGTSTEVIHNA